MTRIFSYVDIDAFSQENDVSRIIVVRPFIL